MTREDFIGFYRQHPGTQKVVSGLSSSEARLRLSGLVGSSTALIAAGSVSHLQVTHLLIPIVGEQIALF